MVAIPCSVDDPSVLRRHRRSRDEAAFRHLVAATFPVFLVIAAVRGLGSALGLVRDDGGPRSVVGRARSMAHAVIPFVFMG
jgi:hypothetical protein